MNDLLNRARQWGREAGLQLLQWHGRAATEEKSDGSVVTEADRAVDAFISGQIRACFPDHAVLSEEGATTYDGQPFTWVIDPLDGTNNYALGVRYWGCSIGVLAAGVPVVGVLVMPGLEAEFWAVRGQGAFLNGVRLGDLPGVVSERNSFVALCSRSWRYLEVSLPQKPRILGSAAYDLAAVAQGIAVASIQIAPHIWDLAAGWLLVQEAGRWCGPLLPNAPDPFPLVAGDDYAGRFFPTAAAATQEMLNAVQNGVHVKLSATARLGRWAVAGWRVGQEVL
jgi:myo-inositol-1(or 4)-monophosphatase